MTAIPNDWREAALGDVCDVVSGATPKTGVPEYWDGHIAWLTPKDMSVDRSKTVSGGARRLTKAGYASCSARLFPAGSVIVSSRAPVGYVAIAGEAMTTNQGCKTAVPPPGISSDYLYWFLIAAKPDLERRASGTTFKELSGKAFAATRLAWPSIREQRRIVAVLEDHLSRLDAADAYLAAALRRGDGWRRRSLANLLDGAPGSEITVMDVLAESMRNGHSARAAAHGVDGVRTLTLTSVTTGDFTDANTKVTIADPGKVKDLWLRRGDVLVQRSNTPDLVGTAAMYEGPDDWAIFPDLLIRLRPDKRKVSSEFLTLALSSARGRSYFRGRAKGLAGSMPKVDQGTIGAFPLMLPNLGEQDRLVQAAAAVDEQHARLTSTSAAAHRRGAALRRALLTAAFTGQLTGRSSDLDVAEELAEAAS